MPRKKCPHCGSRDTAPILYGLPAYSDELQRKLDAKRLVLDGCCVTGNDPSHYCNACEKRFGYPPPIDMLTKVFFMDGGFDCGYPELTVEMKLPGAVATYQFARHDDRPPLVRALSIEEWFAFKNSMFDCAVMDWEPSYVNPDILDGEQWELQLFFERHKAMKIYGDNAFPPYWKQCKEAINSLGFPPY